MMRGGESLANCTTASVRCWRPCRLNLTSVGAEVDRLRQAASTIADSNTLVAGINKEVRTISYLLHPPLLDEAGLASALRWYVEGFSQRSKIVVDLDIREDFARLPRDLETVIFRIVQECLTNIHRHSGSPTARIRVSQLDGKVCLQVEDHGAAWQAKNWRKWYRPARRESASEECGKGCGNSVERSKSIPTGEAP